jgi:hypothetical protein
MMKLNFMHTEIVEHGEIEFNEDFSTHRNIGLPVVLL